MFNVAGESPYDRKVRMLRQLRNTCMACTMCELGFRGVTKDEKIFRDPHVFSNMNPKRVVVVGQNPGFNEVIEGEPFVGDAGRNFDNELAVGGLSRDDFYICNVVRCYTKNNSAPTSESISAGGSFLKMEIDLIKPRLIVALGAASFGFLCPGSDFGSSLGDIVESRFGIGVFATYHPSPLNLQDLDRFAAFRSHMSILCEVVKSISSD